MEKIFKMFKIQSVKGEKFIDASIWYDLEKNKLNIKNAPKHIIKIFKTSKEYKRYMRKQKLDRIKDVK